MRTNSQNGAGFTLLWSSMLNSSLWLEDPATRCVWFTLLMLKDGDGLVRTKSARVIAHAARVSEEEAEKALERFLGPDKESHMGNEDGRRIREVEGGLQIINHEQYRYSNPATREYWRVKKEEQRARDAEKMELARKGRRRRMVEKGKEMGRDMAGNPVPLRKKKEDAA